MNSYPTLTQLLGGYLHQDFLDEFATPMDAVRAFATGEPFDSVQTARGEIVTLLNDDQFRSAPDSVLMELGCFYTPEADGLSPGDWIGQVLEVLQEARSTVPGESASREPAPGTEANRPSLESVNLLHHG